METENGIKDSLSFGPVMPESSVRGKKRTEWLIFCEFELARPEKPLYAEYIYRSDFPGRYDILRLPAPVLFFCPLGVFCYTKCSNSLLNMNIFACGLVNKLF